MSNSDHPATSGFVGQLTKLCDGEPIFPNIEVHGLRLLNNAMPQLHTPTPVRRGHRPLSSALMPDTTVPAARRPISCNSSIQ